MKSRKLSMFCLLLLAGAVSSCGGTSTTSSTTQPTTSDPQPEERYDICFMNGDELVAEYLDQIPGTYVDIPELEPEGRLVNNGWTGISDREFLEGKVRVYETDATYTALWYERFGTENVYDATSLRSSHEIVVDGVKDAAYSDTTAINIESGDVSASAKAYVMFDINHLYVFIEVTDQTNYSHYQAYQNPVSCDGVALYLDLMHNDSLCEPNYREGWGVPYRGNPGPMVEGWYKMSRGFKATAAQRFSDANGSVFQYDGWLSYAAREDGCTTVGTTTETATGYNVEYAIELTNEFIPQEYKPTIGNEFGLSVVLYDQTTTGYSTTAEADSKCGIEPLNLESTVGPKKLSNFVYKQNSQENKKVVSATEVRDCYEVSTLNVRDTIYRDATPVVDDYANSIEILYDDDNYNLFVAKGAGVSNLSIKFDDIQSPYSVTNTSKIIVDKANKYFTVSYVYETQNISIDYFIKETVNNNNLDVARNIYTCQYRNGDITIDGELDNSYDTTNKIDVSYKSLVESAPLDVTAEAYLAFDESYIYVFVDVTDDNVDSTTINVSNPEQNDSVEFWISTTQVVPAKDTVWGSTNRPAEAPAFCGEGLFRMRAGMTQNDGLNGFHWMYDNTAVKREVFSKLTTKGYTVEYKIGWGDFTGNVANGEIVDIMINVSDGENNTQGKWGRHGIVSMNKYGHNAYVQPCLLDHIKLAGM